MVWSPHLVSRTPAPVGPVSVEVEVATSLDEEKRRLTLVPNGGGPEGQTTYHWGGDGGLPRRREEWGHRGTGVRYRDLTTRDPVRPRPGPSTPCTRTPRFRPGPRDPTHTCTHTNTHRCVHRLGHNFGVPNVTRPFHQVHADLSCPPAKGSFSSRGVAPGVRPGLAPRGPSLGSTRRPLCPVPVNGPQKTSDQELRPLSKRAILNQGLSGLSGKAFSVRTNLVFY